MFELETSRTCLRRLTPSDADHVLRIFSDPEAMKYSPAETVQDRAAAADLIGWNQANYERHGVGAWAVIARSSAEFLGLAGLMPHATGWEVFYSFVREHWGQGYATETATACRDHAFARLGQTRLIAIVHPQNLRAVRVALKLGMRESGLIDFWGRPNRLFEILRDTPAR
jgi:RimJ/RimL family protein N-acetyltransferase